MKNLVILFALMILYGCNKPKTVLICGDHICVNQAEAEQYFEENLSLEVQVIDMKKKEEINLVELNLNKAPNGNKEITLLKKTRTNQKLKKLSKNDIKQKKVALKKRQKIKSDQKITKKASEELKSVKKKEKRKSKKSTPKDKKVVYKVNKKTTDICTILDDCSIDEISKYLVNQGKNRKFPDITIRENQ